jgi:hypothetical protein
VVSPSQAEVSDLTAAKPRRSGAGARPTGRGSGDGSRRRRWRRSSRHQHTAARPHNPATAPQPAGCHHRQPFGGTENLRHHLQPMSQLLAQVQQDGATIVVGPLLKDNVEE